MAEKYLVRTEAERFIDNDLSNTAHYFETNVEEKERAGNQDGIGSEVMAGLVFTAFSIEAKLNFVGWKALKNGWPERASFKEKVELINVVLGLNTDWGAEPLQTIGKLYKFRNTLAHGKPDIVDGHSAVVDVEPEVWEALKMQWEEDVNSAFLNKCRSAEDEFWKTLLKSAGIEMHQTLTHGGHSLSALTK